MAYEKTLSGALTLQNGRPAEALSGVRPAAAAQSGLFAAHMDAANGQSRAQALDTLNRMLDGGGGGGDAMHSLRNSLSNMALAGLTRLTQSEIMGPVAESALSADSGGEAVARSGRARFDIRNVERIRTRFGAAKPAASGKNTAGNLPGAVSARFESGADGIAAIGYDRTGGTSYGKYQIASTPGTMSDFIKFLKTEAPDLAARLEKAGTANTGGKTGAMPTAWRAIAAKQPERFERLQDAFISKSHFEPTLAAISKETGLRASEFSDPLKEAMWSTAVQHGPSAASRIFVRAIDTVGALFDSHRGALPPATPQVRDGQNPSGVLAGGKAAVDRQAESDGKLPQNAQESVIREVYAIRATQFGSSTPQVQDAVQQRLVRERDLLLAHAAGQKQTNSVA